MPPNRHPTERLLVTAARRRARGASLDSIARQLGLDPDELEDLIDARRAVYLRYHNRAARDTLEDTFGEAVLILRKHMRSDKEDLSMWASEVFARTFASLHRHSPKPRPAAGQSADGLSIFAGFSHDQLR